MSAAVFNAVCLSFEFGDLLFDLLQADLLGEFDIGRFQQLLAFGFLL